MRRILFLGALLGLLITGCAPDPQRTIVDAGDVRVDGHSVLGAWNAIGAPDQAEIDRDLRSGMLSRMLVFNPYGRVTLSGSDRREGSGAVTFEGRIRGNEITFADLPGTARVSLRNHRTLEFTDPRGNRTIYRRQN